MLLMTSVYKIAYHQSRIESYLRKEPIFPVTLELNLTTNCNRTCLDCPSGLGLPNMNLGLSFINNLFKSLDGQTKGIILTGGEPTLSPVFAETLFLASKKYHFKDIAVITNGSCLDNPSITEALVANASAVRISLYDWINKSLKSTHPTLNRIKTLRNRIEGLKSKLQIGVSVLTTNQILPALAELTDQIFTAGAHWVYFHPTCFKSVNGDSNQKEQTEVLESIEQMKIEHKNEKNIHFINERFNSKEIHFNSFHAAHFVLVIGADGKNYLSSEVKYQPNFSIADFNTSIEDNFLWDSSRIKRIQSITHKNYSGFGSRNRGVLYNSLIESLINGKMSLNALMSQISNYEIYLPHII